MDPRPQRHHGRGRVHDRRDGGRSRRATITTATNSTVLFTQPTGSATFTFYNFILSNTASTRAAALAINSGAGNTFSIYYKNCVMTGFTSLFTMANASTIAALTIDDSDISSFTSSVVDLSSINAASFINMSNSYCHSNTGHCLASSANGNSQITLTNNVFYGNGSDAVLLKAGQAGLYAAYNVFMNNTGNGLLTGPSTSNVFSAMIVNNVFYGNSLFGFSNNTSGVGGGLLAATIRNNGFGNNTSGSTSIVSTPVFVTVDNGISLTVDPFVSSGTGNFALNNTASVGALQSSGGSIAGYPIIR